MSPIDMHYVFDAYCKELYGRDIEDYDINPKASMWMSAILSDLKENIDMIHDDIEPPNMGTWLNQHYPGLFQRHEWRFVPVQHQPTNTAYYSFGRGGRMVCMRCSKRLDH